jgi:hypothetical protein
MTTTGKLYSRRQEMSDYSIALQRVIEHIHSGTPITVELEVEAPHHAKYAKNIQSRIAELEAENAKLRKIVADGIYTCQQHDRGLIPVSLIAWEAETIKKLAALENK